MKLKNRDKLKDAFKGGRMPSEGDFETLIDSMINRVDDGFSKDMENGLMLSPEGSSRKLIGFFRSIEQKNPAWSVSLDADDTHKGLCFTEPGPEGGVRLFLQEGGNVGIGTLTPSFPLEVEGVVGMKGRIGTFASGKIPADGKWHNMLEHLNGCQAFEIVARVGSPGKGRYALLFATAASTFGRSKSCIEKMQAHYGWWWNKLAIRWKGSTFDYGMQIKTRRNYGENVFIDFHISKLWGDEEMGYSQQTRTGTV
jgi:hypothetical protein